MVKLSCSLHCHAVSIPDPNNPLLAWVWDRYSVVQNGENTNVHTDVASFRFPFPFPLASSSCLRGADTLALL